jgi:Trypsin-co-occurring domain 1
MGSIVRFAGGEGENIYVELSGAAPSPPAPHREKLAAGESDLDALITGVQIDASRGALSSITEAAQAKFEVALSSVTPTIESIHKTLQRIAIPLDAVEVEFGLKLTAGAHAIISAGSEANFNFRVTWKPGTAGRESGP